MAIRLVSFDALHTLVTPRLPIHVQYAQTFEPYLGVLDPNTIKCSFKSAFRQVQQEYPVYRGGAEGWWRDVIQRTAVGAGADPQAVNSSLDSIVPRLLHRFSSSEGYKLFDDVLPTLTKLRELNVQIAIISNTDTRMRNALGDLGVSTLMDTILLSDEEGVEKPSCEIFSRACRRMGVEAQEALHVGDELDCDYRGAMACGLRALLVRRHGPDGEGERKDDNEDLTDVQFVAGLEEVAERVRRRNML